MELYAKDHRDIQRYFGNTFVKLPQYGDKVFRVAEVKATHVLLKDKEQDIYKIELADEGEPAYSFDYVLPHKAVFFCQGKTLLLQRRPARQYFRGCCSENTQVLDIETGRLVGLSYEVLEGFAMKPPYFSFQQALEKLSAKVTCVPLTKRFSLSRNMSVYVDNKAIGIVDQGLKKLVLFDNAKIFVAEMKTLVTDTEYEVVDANLKAL